MGVVCAGTVVIIAGVHMQQTGERVEMHKGVLLDKERIRLKALRLKQQKEEAAKGI
eukprot:CAMPEP_0119040650 /NCGR_PEP_ID=MMETSP1177-20130426/10662_1 /TAXON_ID=2985 /ORGANISM="Ochromonas sp, Strain CCMP1899" /LENGTH=55 /DNA_ID=CAMNT_0007005935 /DNA_START=174 /DNA_END=341 /DNA_ORIENTATION=-